MTGLIFIGLGLHDGRGTTIGGLKEIHMAKYIFAEFYTTRLTGTTVTDLEERLGKRIRVLDRKAVEEGEVILEAAAQSSTVFLCPGDPMSATTHLDLRIRAIERGIETKIVHGPSIFTAAPSLLGLQHYKFGRTTTLPFPKEGYSPESPYDVIGENRSRGQHTLVLLDIDEEEDRLMTASEAISILLRIESKRKESIFTENTLVCVVARAGSDRPLVRADLVGTLVEEEFGGPHHSLVIPGDLHFMEAEALVKLAGAPAELLDEER